MTFDEYQRSAIKFSAPLTESREALEMSVLGMCGEAGEVADLIKKHLFHGHQLSSSKLHEELGDVLWYVSRMCWALGFSLESVAIANIEKLNERYPEGFSSERSINRGE